MTDVEPNDARAEAQRRYGTPRESDLLPSDYVTIGQIEGYVEGRLAAARAETTPEDAIADYRSGAWCGDCRHGVVGDPPCCTQPTEATTAHEHIWQWRRTLTSRGDALPPIEVCQTEGCDAARSAETTTWCNCQAVPGSQNYPGPWHEKGGEKHYPCAETTTVWNSTVTDAQVLAALNAMHPKAAAPSLDYWGTEADKMRTALRAAWTEAD